MNNPLYNTTDSQMLKKDCTFPKKYSSALAACLSKYLNLMGSLVSFNSFPSLACKTGIHAQNTNNLKVDRMYTHVHAHMHNTFVCGSFSNKNFTTSVPKSLIASPTLAISAFSNASFPARPQDVRRNDTTQVNRSSSIRPREGSYMAYRISLLGIWHKQNFPRFSCRQLPRKACNRTENLQREPLTCQ